MQTNGTPPRSPQHDEKHRREMRRFYRSAAFFLQIGWSVVTPIVLFPWLGSWLSDRYSLGTWPTVVGVVLGLLTAVVTFVRMFRTLLAPTLAEEEPAPPQAEENRPSATESDPATAAEKGKDHTPPPPSPGTAAAEKPKNEISSPTADGLSAGTGTNEDPPSDTDRKEMRP